MHHHALSADIQSCIRDCLHCHQECPQTAMGHCLEIGDEHVEPEHFRLMVACAEICRTAAAVMMSQVPQHASVCRACADICEACAASCATLTGMDACVEACQRCAVSCRSMAAAESPHTMAR